MQGHCEVGVTLVALYGPKPPRTLELLDVVQAELAGAFGDAFTAYDVDQVHATVVGLEGYRVGPEILNTNFTRVTGERRAMDLKGLFSFLNTTPLLPLRIRIGGFERARTYPFTSRGLHPYVRSFALCGPHAVTMGWPVGGIAYGGLLGDLRRKCADYNVLHKYHEHPVDSDNDFFFVLGQIERDSVSPAHVEAVQDRVRRLLAARAPLDIVIGPEQLAVVVYRDSQLPLSSSVGYTLAEAQARLEELKGLYPRG